jgi:hypothetical protein
MAIPQQVTKVLKKAPYDLIAFFLFSLVVVTFSLYLRLDVNKQLYASLLPYLGHGFSNGYFFPLIFIPLMLSSSQASETKTLAVLRCMLLVLLSFPVYDGVQDYLNITPEDYTNPNPYLRYDALTPIYTIAVPTFWSLLMVFMLLRSSVKHRAAKV